MPGCEGRAQRQPDLRPPHPAGPCPPGAGLPLPLGHPESLANCPPDDLDVLAIGECLVDGPAAKISQDMVLRDALCIDVTELLAHLRPEHCQPHARQVNRPSRGPTNSPPDDREDSL